LKLCPTRGGKGGGDGKSGDSVKRPSGEEKRTYSPRGWAKTLIRCRTVLLHRKTLRLPSLQGKKRKCETVLGNCTVSLGGEVGAFHRPTKKRRGKRGDLLQKQNCERGFKNRRPCREQGRVREGGGKRKERGLNRTCVKGDLAAN